MARIPEETIDEILHATDIVDLVGARVKLRRSGAGYSGLCPFHNEKTPSFHVNPGRQSFKCFGCGEGGSPITFLMKMDGLHFVEAAKLLAEKANIPIQEEAYDPEAERARKRRGHLARLHNEAANWYHKLLLTDKGPGGNKVREYLKSRGINSQIAKDWLLGYAPAYDDAHRQWAQQMGASESDLIEAGIFGERRDGRGGYPRFRDRLMFPIRNDHGDVIAFSGRLLDPEAKTAKYLNSPETPLFVKSRTFFGLDRSKRDILREDSVIICEGQLDLITAFEHGTRNLVAPLGTAFTDEHARMLKRHAAEAILCFDADAAGYKAAVRTFGTLAEAGFSVRAARMPDGEDPDTLIRGQGIEVFEKLIEEAPEFYMYQLEKRGDELDIESAQGRATMAEELSETLARIQDRVLLDAAVDQASKRLSIASGTLRERVTKAAERARRFGEARDRRRQVREEKDGAPPHEDEGSLAAPREISIRNPTVVALCRIALESPEAKKWLLESDLETVLAEIPESGILHRIWTSDFDPADIASVEQFLSFLDPEELARVRFCQKKGITSETPLEDTKILVGKLEIQRLDSLIASARAELREPSLDPEKRGAIQLRLDDLEKEFLDLRRG